MAKKNLNYYISSLFYNIQSFLFFLSSQLAARSSQLADFSSQNGQKRSGLKLENVEPTFSCLTVLLERKHH